MTAWGRGRSVARPVRANLVCRGGSTVVRTDVISLYLFVFKRLNGVVRGADNSYDDFRSVFGLAGWVEHALGSCSSPSEGLRWASRHPVSPPLNPPTFWMDVTAICLSSLQTQVRFRALRVGERSPHIGSDIGCRAGTYL